jgi:hypothetical protein
MEDDRRDLQQGTSKRGQHRETGPNPGNGWQQHANTAGDVLGEAGSKVD